jgi:hypothetical protein
LRTRPAPGTLKIRMRGQSARYVAVVGMLAWATLAAFSTWPASRHIRTDDRNGDGRPDSWRTYDRHGQLVERAIDSNFDGRSDVHEYYTRGELVRRESDRNFDDRIDLVEEFDTTTHEQVRSVADSDFDGTADVLVLFRAGRPVFIERVASSVRLGDLDERHTKTMPLRRGDAPLARFSDPFARELALRSTPTTPDTNASVWTATGVFVCPTPPIRGVRILSAIRRSHQHPVLVSPVLGSPSLRGPPLA